MKITHLLFAILLTALAILLPSNQAKISRFHAVDSIEKSNNSINPPAARTGAPGESNCTICHGGTTQSASGNIDVTFSGAGNEYIVGQSYTITISIAAGAKNGFQATILDNTNTKAGTFTSGTNYGLTNSGGRQYARQNVSSGVTSWTIHWTAPATDVGDLTFYFAFNKSNNMGNTSGDIIYLGQFNIASAVFNTITEHEKTDQQIRMWYDQHNGSLNYNFTLQESADIMLNVQDLSGKLIFQQKSGVHAPGEYQTNSVLTERPEAGIYIVSLFIDNPVFNRKILID
ncbi:MAG: hypothetical protein IPG07_00335 [Crocinitomicaceae bacterium]|nr:hypothetical protein [Crocinitomicaceae bacterium]